MNHELILTLDDNVVMRVDGSAGVPGHLRAVLEKMDVDMDAGVQLQGEKISAPDSSQRAHYVISRLLDMLSRGDEKAVRVMCTYLARRLPDLGRIEVQSQGQEWAVKLAYRQSAGSAAE